MASILIVETGLLIETNSFVVFRTNYLMYRVFRLLGMEMNNPI